MPQKNENARDKIEITSIDKEKRFRTTVETIFEFESKGVEDGQKKCRQKRKLVDRRTLQSLHLHKFKVAVVQFDSKLDFLSLMQFISFCIAFFYCNEMKHSFMTSQQINYFRLRNHCHYRQ